MRKAGKFRQSVAVLLSVLMVVSMLPQNSVQALAAEKAAESAEAVGNQEEISDNTGETEEQEDFSGEDATSEDESGVENPEDGDESAEENPTDGDESVEENPEDGDESTEENPTDGDESAEENPADGDETGEEESADSEGLSDNTVDETVKLFEAENGIKSTSSDADFVISGGVLTDYTGTATELVIPDGVTKIGDKFLQNNKTVTSVTFSASVTSVGNYAFQNCTKLGTVTLNEGLITIGQEAFENAGFGEELSTGAVEKRTLTIPSTVQTIEKGAFRGSEYLKEVLFAEGGTAVLTIESDTYATYRTFADCASLERVELPKRLEKLPTCAFEKCAKLEEVTMQEGLKEIGKYVFSGCGSLKGIAFPSTVTSVGDYAFQNCKSLGTVTLNEGLITIGQEAFENAGFGEELSTGAVEKRTLTIPSTVQTIGKGAFRGSEYLKEVLFADGGTAVLTIESDTYATYRTFADCASLERVELPKRLEKLPTCAFEKCAKLEEVTMQEGLKEIGKYVFAGCGSLKGIAFPSTVTSVGDYAFQNCKSLGTVTLNEGLITIGQEAFENAGFGEELSTGAVEKRTLTIPSTVQTIGKGAFRGSEYLKEVLFADGGTAVLTIESESYSAYRTFADCASLERVELPKRLEKLPACAFENCAKLEEVTMQEGLKEIEKYVFAGCGILKGIAFPSTVTSVGDYAFQNCKSLGTVTLNEGLITIGQEAFENAGFGKKLSTGTVEKQTLTIPSTVRTIGKGAFRGSEYLKEVIFADGDTAVLTIESESYSAYRTFADCASLERVELPKRLEKLPACAFENCAKLEEVTMQEGLKEIEKYVFSGCGSLKGIAFPSTVTSVGDYAFQNCKSLGTVTLNEGLITIGQEAFENAGFGKKLSTGTVEKQTLTIPSTVRTIGKGAFRGSEYLKEVIFADGDTVVLTIESESYSTYRTFADCENLERAILPKRLEKLSKYAFYNCAKLNAVYIPEYVTEIADGALEKCPKLVIYGTPGSEAERYAKANKIPFKEGTDSSLGLFVTGVILNRTKITKTGESAIGQTVQLTATVLPDTAQNKSVSYASSNEAVATVNGSGLVTITGYGSATITVTTKDGSYQATCAVSVLRQWTQEELEEIKSALQTQNQTGWTVVTNRLTDIKDLKINIPSGAEYNAKWKLDYDVETGSNNHYDICIRQNGYQDAVLRGFTVTGVTLEGVAVRASSQFMKVEAGKELTLTAEAEFSGLPDGVKATGLYKVEWKSANTSAVSIVKEEQVSEEKSAQAVVRGVKKASNIAVTATIVLLNQDGVPLSKDKDKKGKTWFETTVKISVLDQPVTDRIVITALDGNNQEIELTNLQSLIMNEQDTVYQLKAAVYAGETQVQTPNLTWKSSNTALATVTGKDSAVTLTIKGKQKGSAVITATSAKDSGYVMKFRIVVKDSTPRLEETKVTFNLYKEALEETVHLLPSDGYQINTESLSILNKDGSQSVFEVKKSETGTDSYCISVKAGQQLNTGKQNLLLSVKTSAEEETPHQIPLTVQVVKTAPKLTIKQEAIELYRKDAVGTVRLSSTEEIESIQYTSSTGSASARLVQKNASPAEGTFTFGLENASADTYKKAGAKGTLSVKFKGYKAEASYNKALTLSVNKKLPAVKAVAEHSVLYPGTVLDSTTISFYDKDGRPLSGNISVEQDGAAPKKTEVSVGKTAQGAYEVQVRALSGAAGKLTVKCKIQDENWYESIKVSCAIQTQKKTALTFESSTLNLNTAYDIGRYEAVSTRMFLKGFEDREIVSMTVSGADKKSVEAQKALVFGQEEDRMTVGIKDADFFKKAGTYQYNVSVRLKDSLTVEGKVKIAVKKTTASVSLKAKGSIDLLNRAGTEIVYTPVLKNYTDRVAAADLYGERAGSFYCIYNSDDGKIHLQAKEGASLKRNTAYKLKVRLTLESGVELVAPVTVKLQQKAVKLQKSVETVTLFESVNKEVCKRDIAFSVKDNVNNVAISNVELVNGFDTFTYEYTGNGKGKIWVSDMPSGKTNKKYTLKFAVTFEDGASNAAPVYVTVKVDYRK